MLKDWSTLKATPLRSLPFTARRALNGPLIPINTGTLLRSREAFVYRAADNTMHWVIGDVVPPDLLLALESEGECLARERERLWYVAFTPDERGERDRVQRRARDRV